jgi:hypothetical protein
LFFVLDLVLRKESLEFVDGFEAESPRQDDADEDEEEHEPRVEVVGVVGGGDFIISVVEVVGVGVDEVGHDVKSVGEEKEEADAEKDFCELLVFVFGDEMGKEKRKPCQKNVPNHPD